MPAPPDSVPLAAPPAEPRLGLSGAKLIAVLFLAFLFVSSSTFVNAVLAPMGEKTVRGGLPTAWGHVVQGLILVLLYILAAYLEAHQML